MECGEGDELQKSLCLFRAECVSVWRVVMRCCLRMLLIISFDFWI